MHEKIIRDYSRFILVKKKKKEKEIDNHEYSPFKNGLKVNELKLKLIVRVYFGVLYIGTLITVIE